ncbi:hypothetical protein LIA77_09523 [Sarocladium implicatum]|nr:hypothetical protein LIA77_09523 [Sarocladium implicatum]
MLLRVPPVCMKTIIIVALPGFAYHKTRILSGIGTHEQSFPKPDPRRRKARAGISLSTLRLIQPCWSVFTPHPITSGCVIAPRRRGLYQSLADASADASRSLSIDTGMCHVISHDDRQH